MRSPRALIPLLSVCAAAAIVTAAAASAGIEGLPGGGPAHADSAVTPPDPATINAMSWNVCGAAEPGCPLGASPDRLTDQVVKQMRTTEVGGRKVKPNAVFLQEVCEGHVREFRKAMSGWTWTFAPVEGAACPQDQGRLGVAIGTDTPQVDLREEELPAPAGRKRIALCGNVPSWSTRVCVTQFSMSEDGTWRRKQAAALADLAGTGRVLVGGDLADGPGNPPLDPLYAAYAECDQTGTSRTGANTRQDWRGNAVDKTSYLFITKSAAASCSVPTTRTKTSDHRPLSAIVRYH